MSTMKLTVRVVEGQDMDDTFGTLDPAHLPTHFHHECAKCGADIGNPAMNYDFGQQYSDCPNCGLVQSGFISGKGFYWFPITKHMDE